MDAPHRPKPVGTGMGVFLRMLKMVPVLSGGCKRMTQLRRPASTVTLFGRRRGRVSLAIQEDSQALPAFLIELPMVTMALHKEMASGAVRLALECEARTVVHRRRLLEEYVWAAYCNGRKLGYSVRRRKQTTTEEGHVLQTLRGVSVGVGVLPCSSEKELVSEGEMTYMRARFERVIGSRDSEALHMINPDGSGEPELSIFLMRVR